MSWSPEHEYGRADLDTCLPWASTPLPLALGKAVHRVMSSGELALPPYPLQPSGDLALNLAWAEHTRAGSDGANEQTLGPEHGSLGVVPFLLPIVRRGELHPHLTGMRVRELTLVSHWL